MATGKTMEAQLREHRAALDEEIAERDAERIALVKIRVRTFADKIMSMIDADIAKGAVPANVASFSALHDHVDANTYVIDALEGVYPRGDDDAEVIFSDEELDMSNAVMDEVHERLAARQAS